MSKDIDIQREQVFKGNFKVELKSACKVGNGVLRLSAEDENIAISAFEKVDEVPSFFIPASGSGSRMFQFLFEWSEKTNGNGDLDEVFQTLSELAVGRGVLNETSDAEEFISRMLEEMACKPKGLIPFHTLNGEVYTAFQEHVLQVKELFPNGVKLHFTVQESFEEKIKTNISSLGDRAEGVDISYSHQSSSSDAFCFDVNGGLFEDENGLVRRPAGHGALLENLNALPERLVYIKNIDNIQHANKAGESMRVWKIATGLLKTFEADLKELADNFYFEGVKVLNAKYQFLSAGEEKKCDPEMVKSLASRPSRVCGMVKNEGEPGGGPFWIEDHNGVTKQIIEKVQISEENGQQEIVEGSSHFNPVFMVVSKADVYGNDLDLMNFRDDSKFFTVRKSHKGSEIVYRELPGLWNGSMSNWNTLFLEIPSSVFSPVKTVLDLAKPPHLA